MISAITVKNFNGVKHQEFSFKNVSVVLDGDGVGSFLSFNALLLLDRLARGMLAVSAPYGLICDSSPTYIKLRIFNAQFGEFVYEVTLQRFGLTTLIKSEKMHSADSVLLIRNQQYYSCGNNSQRFLIDSTQSALAVTMPFLGMDPIAALRSELTQAWLVMPNLAQMVSAIHFRQMDRDIGLLYLASYIVNQQQTHPVIYGAMMETLRRLGSDITGFGVEANSLNPMYLAVQRGNRYENRRMPFELVANNEKVLIFAAFIRAVNEYVNPITVVWHSPLNWLGQKEGDSVIKMLAKSFSMKGQLIMLSREYDHLRGVK